MREMRFNYTEEVRLEEMDAQRGLRRTVVRPIEGVKSKWPRKAVKKASVAWV